jgi:hypothetical protein
VLRESIQDIINFYYELYPYEFKNFNDIIKFAVQLRKDQTKFKHLILGWNIE